MSQHANEYRKLPGNRNYLNGSYDKICKERETDEVLFPTNTVGTLRCIYSLHGNR